MPTTPEFHETNEHDEELAGLDVLDSPTTRRRKWWPMLWPKLAAIAIGLSLWQLVVWSGWKPEYALPGPASVFSTLWELLLDGKVFSASWVTLQRAIIGYGLALIIGVVIGALIVQSKILRSAFGSFVTGLQTMPSIAWFPLAILLFQISEQAILFVVVLGAAPAIANGLISGADAIPPTILRAGRVLGARRFNYFRYVILPGAMPGFAAGTKQGWSFAWRSLMAGELLVIIAKKQSIGALLTINRSLSDATGMIAWMIVILVIGILADALVFSRFERAVLKRWGLANS